MQSIVSEPNAKINLGLIIKGKRPDGYHLLETVFLPVDLKDRMVVTKTGNDRCEIDLKGISIDAPTESNLCWKAWKALQEKYPKVGGVRIELEKGIPSGAGLGGGSSDAAFTLKSLNALFGLALPVEKLAEVAATLGADCPFFLYNQPMFASGIGTELEPISLDLPYRIEVVPSEIHSSTPAAYKGLDWSHLDTESSLKELLKLPVTEWKSNLRNDLEGPVFAQYPTIKAAKESLYKRGAVYAAMSGSGSAVFGLFPQ